MGNRVKCRKRILVPFLILSMVIASFSEALSFGFIAHADENSEEIDINSSIFPDNVFRCYILNNIDTNYDDKLNQEEMDAVTVIDISGTETSNGCCKSLKGIEYFTNLRELYCNYNQLETLDLRDNPNLVGVFCLYNQLNQIDVSNNSMLQALACGGNNLSTLDVSHNPQLWGLLVSVNQLQDLDVSHNPELRMLDCFDNQFSTLDISHNPSLIDIYNKGLKEQESNYRTYQNQDRTVILRIGNEIKLITDQIEINYDNFPDSKFRTYVKNFDKDNNNYLDLEEINDIKQIDLFSKNIWSLKGIEFLSQLEKLDCGYNQLTELDVSRNKELKYLNCQKNKLNSLDLKNNTKLEYLNCALNELDNIHIENNPIIADLYRNGIKKVNTVNGTEYVYYRNADNSRQFYVNSSVTIFDGSGVPSHILINEENFPDESFRSQVSTFFVWDKNHDGKLSISEIDAIDSVIIASDSGVSSLKGIEYFTNVDFIHCLQNNISILDVSNNRKLKTLSADYNQIESIDLRNNTKLEHLHLDHNQLKELDISNNKSLKQVRCSDNQISTLDTSHNFQLIRIDCIDNQIENLDLSNNPLLAYLYCDGNNIHTLDISNNYILIDVYLNGTRTVDGNVVKYESDSGCLRVNKDVIISLLTFVPEKKATCTKAGNKAYYVDKDDNWYQDEDGTQLIKDHNSVVIPATGHKWGKWEVITFPTTNSTGRKERICQTCGKSAIETIPEIEKKEIPIKLKNTSEGIKITWSSVEFAEKYRVYKKNSSGKWEKIAVVSKLNYTDTASKPGERCTYTIMAQTAAGEVISNYGTGKGITCTKPVTTTVKYKSSGVSVSWESAEKATKYRVFRKTGTADWKEIATTKSLSYVDKTVVYGKTYIYMVRAIGTDGKYISDSGTGAEILYMTSAPKITLTNAEDGINISWKAMTGAAKYYVYVKKPSGKWSRIAIVESGTDYTDKAVVPGNSYTYSVVGIDSKGHAMNENGEGKTIIRNNVYVKNITLISTTSGFEVHWDAFEGAIKYRVYRKNSSGKWTKLVAVETLFYVDPDAVVNSENTYAILAVAEDGTVLSEYGNGKTGVFVIPPTSLTAASKASGVRLEWDSVIKAEKYQIYRKTKSTDWAKIGTTTGLSYTDKSAESGKTYFYSVIALDAKGKALSDYGEGTKIKYVSPKSDALETEDIFLEGFGIEEPIEEEQIVTEEEESDEDEVVSEDEEVSEDEISEEDTSDETTDEDALNEDESKDDKKEDSESEEDEEVIEENQENPDGSEIEAVTEESDSEEESEDLDSNDSNEETAGAMSGTIEI